MDVWADDEPDALAKVRRDHSNAGYLAGITEAKIRAHQPGFDEGYVEGAAMGLQVGRIIGAFQAAGLRDIEKAALEEMSPRKLFCSEYYDANARPLFTGDHPLVERWRQRQKQIIGDIH